MSFAVITRTTEQSLVGQGKKRRGEKWDMERLSSDTFPIAR